MQKIGAKIDCVIIGAANTVVWLASFDVLMREVFTLLSLAFLAHRYWHWVKTKDKKRGEEEENL